MLRLLLTSAARTSSRSLFTKSNAASVFVSSCRMVSDKSGTKSGQKKRAGSFWVPFAGGFCYVSSLWMFYAYMSLKQYQISCSTGSFPLTVTAPESKNEQAWKGKWREGEVKKADPIEDGTIAFGLFSPWFVPVEKKTFMLLPALTFVRLPNGSPSTDFKEICEWLKQHDIHAEQSDEGARRGLAEFAAHHMRRGVVKHCQKKCGCPTSSATKATPPTSNPAS